MPEAGEKSVMGMLKADVAETVWLYFAPVRAIVGEFRRAISSANENRPRTAKRTVPAA